MVLASQAGDAACDVTPKACDVWFDDLHVVNGSVTDTVHPYCADPPQWHVLHAWIEYKRIGEFAQYGRRQVVTEDIPDDEGFDVTVTVGDCVEGWYRTAARAEGVGPVEQYSQHGVPFDVTLYSPHTYLTAEDCRGGS